MKRYPYKGQMLTINELSERCGVRRHTLRDRLRRGYSVDQAIRPLPTNDSVVQFCDASFWEDWIGLSISDLYEIYWKWCVSQELTPTSKQGFSRHVNQIYPHLKTVPTRRGEQCHRIIRQRELEG